ncbi:MAG: hydrogen peroxide-inducible genes activator [Balneolaceae bacterium]
MTLTQLSYIVAIDKYRHFATAAEKIYVTQPTLSMQIHKLEEQLGVKIFDRSKSPVVPTEIGEQIIEQAKKILRESKHIEDLANQSDDLLKGAFNVGVIPTIAPYLIPLFLRNFVNKHPEVELTFKEMLTNEVLEGLSDDTLDVGIIATPVDQSHIYVEDLYLEPFVGYLSHDHPLGKIKKLKVKDLDQRNIWLLNEGHCFRDQAVKLCKQVRDQGNKAIQFDSGNLETLKKLVEQNFGMTLLPWLAIQEFDENCSNAVLREFQQPVPSRKVRLAYGRKYLKQNIIRVFMEEIQSNLPAKLKKEEDLIVIEK